MGWSSFVHGNKRHHMSSGNARTAEWLAENAPNRLKDHLDRNTVSITKVAEILYSHPMAQEFPAEQRGPGYEGVPPTEVPIVGQEMTQEEEKNLLDDLESDPNAQPNPAVVEKDVAKAKAQDMKPKDSDKPAYRR